MYYRKKSQSVMEGTEVTFLFQFGLIRDTVTVDSSTLTLKALKELACDFMNTKCPEHGLNHLFERLILFKHDYNSTNVLQLITNTTEIVDETLVEIVLSGKQNHSPTTCDNNLYVLLQLFVLYKILSNLFLTVF